MNEATFNQADYTFVSADLPADSFRVVRFKGREALSRLFEFEVLLAADTSSFDLDASVGAGAMLSLQGPVAGRFVHGILERFELLAVGRKQSIYSVILRPTITPLAYRHTSRVFQEMSIPDIVREVLEDAGFGSDVQTWRLLEKHSVRNYCIQYQETDLNFVSRLLEEEGIYFYFHHTAERDIVVFADGIHATDPLVGMEAVEFGDESSERLMEDECLFRFQGGSSMYSGAVRMRDYRFAHPGIDLEAHRAGGSFESLEKYFYPGEYVEPEIGNRLAEVRLEEEAVPGRQYRGIGNCRAMVPGFRFKLELHPCAEFDEEYLVLEVEHRGHEPQALLEEHGIEQEKGRPYECRLLCIPSRVPYRPARLARRPIIAGLQSAIVVGPAGEEIYCDEHGRVKIQFHWDRQGKRDDHSSCWVRVSQLWAGAGWGAMYIPRIGHEVLVQFLEGDPDRPVVVGRVYNGDNRPPYTLPADRTRSTLKSDSSPGGGGSNELRFEDQAGKEEIYLHAQKDWTIRVENDKNQSIGHDESLNVGNDRKKTVGHDEIQTVGNDRTRTVGHDEALTIGNNRNKTVGVNETISVGAQRSTSVGANDSTQVGANESTCVGAQRTVTVGGSQAVTVALGSAETVGGGKALSVGGAYQVTVGGAKNTSVGLSHTEEVGKIRKVVAGESFELICGQGSIKVDKSGRIVISGTQIELSATGAVTVKGKVIDLN